MQRHVRGAGLDVPERHLDAGEGARTIAACAPLRGAHAARLAAEFVAELGDAAADERLAELARQGLRLVR